jgi:hypothetical protein
MFKEDGTSDGAREEYSSDYTITPVKIGTVIVGEFRARKRRKFNVPLAVLRISSIVKLINGRYGGPCDTDDGETYYDAALPSLIERANYQGRAVGSRAWAEQFTPRLLDEHPPEWFAAAEDEAMRFPRALSADDIAKLLKVTADEVKRFDLRTFGAIDRPAKQRKDERKAADRAYQKRKRHEQGATPREQSLTARKPWSAIGISRSAFYKRGLHLTVSNPET